MQYVLGVDEAGRGPLAGPVAVGVVRLPQNFDIALAFPGLNDSKKLTPRAREALFERLVEEARRGVVLYHVELVEARVINERGIGHAVLSGVSKGVETLLPDARAGRVWLDGLLKAPLAYAQETVTGGDATVPAIMLASVAAKVVRDRHMAELSARYPAYGFEKHKGYGTRAHYEALRTHGMCDIHRPSYIHLDELDPVRDTG